LVDALLNCSVQDLYAELSEQCKKYACNLLDQCRSSEEVIAVLNRSKLSASSSSSSCASSEIDDCDDQIEEDFNDIEDIIESDREDDVEDDEQIDEVANDGEERLTLDRFKLALKYEQKQVNQSTVYTPTLHRYSFLLLGEVKVKEKGNSPDSVSHDVSTVQLPDH
jgi:hypothetical protein